MLSQVFTSSGCHIYPDDIPGCGSIRHSGATTKRLSKVAVPESGYAVLPQNFLSVLISTGGYHLTHMDEFVDSLLNEERVCDIIMPRITKREVLEDLGELSARKSRLLDAMEGKSERGSSRSKSRSRSRGSGRSRSRNRSRSGSRSPGAHSQSASRSDAGSRYVSRSPSRSRSASPRLSMSRGASVDEANGGGSDRFRSRSRSISPDRMETATE